MNIRVYPVAIEAVDDSNELVFRMETFDEASASLEVKAFISPGNVDDVCVAIRHAVTLLELKEFAP